MLKLDATQENQKRNCGRLLQLQSQQQNLVGQLSSSLMRWMPSALGATHNISMRPELLHSYSLSWMGQLHRKVFASHPVSVHPAQLTLLHRLAAISMSVPQDVLYGVCYAAPQCCPTGQIWHGTSITIVQSHITQHCPNMPCTDACAALLPCNSALTGAGEQAVYLRHLDAMYGMH